MMTVCTNKYGVNTLSLSFNMKYLQEVLLAAVLHEERTNERVQRV